MRRPRFQTSTRTPNDCWIAAASYAVLHGSRKTCTEHLLVALAGQSDSVRRLLAKLEVDPDLVSRTTEEELAEPTGPT